MKGLALALWFAASALLVCVLQLDTRVSPRSDVLVGAGRLLVIAPPIPVAVLPQEPVPAMAAAPVAGCSRLGVFPRRDWAERVAAILMENAPEASWRVQRVGLNAYYLLFEAWSIDELAARMTLQRALLKSLLSISAIPETC